ncbi:MAG TPA: helix-turn-helix transcriptional regulator [Tepidisphaeraceae bacterium]|jgi:predicted XRE-type DNA-binding protein
MAATKRTLNTAVKIRQGKANVFAELGFAPDEAENLRVRAQLMLHLRDVIAKRKLTQARAAKLFGVTQPRVSALVRGKIELFSVDTLISMLARAGVKVAVTVHPRAA